MSSQKDTSSIASLIPVMTPVPGERLQLYVGDRVRFHIRDRDGNFAPKGWRALLRTNLGRAEVLRREIVQAHTQGLPLAGASWRDLPMQPDEGGWTIEVPLAEVGFFQAKAYLLDERGWQHWPSGPDIGISVHPAIYRSGNTIYCAFTRMFGPTRSAKRTLGEALNATLAPLDKEGYAIIPPSGKMRDLVDCLPHIMDTLGCRILQLLPVNPTPTTYARFGRFGSPYAALDLTGIDPALVVFDQRTTGVDQFRELTYAVHLRGGRVLLDIVINHTGWGSTLQENHPEWFLRHSDGRFASPGAWGTTWEDLVELKHQNVALWDMLAEVFLTWCRRGVDGFRCDAGYMVPVAAWQYIIARVQAEYPDTLFLLEGLGGAWEATEALLTEGGMQWAYSELFQNYSPQQVAGYLDHALKQSERVGLLVHFSETHDNDRLAARGRAWSLLRNRLCALASVSGGFAFTCGVEWLASEKIKVHGSTGLAWGNEDNLLPELAALNAVLANHPCFFDGAKLKRLSAFDSPVLALHRESAEGKDQTLILVNTDAGRPQVLRLEPAKVAGSGVGGPERAPGRLEAASAFSGISDWVDLLGQISPEVKQESSGRFALTLPAGAVYCLAPARIPVGLHGEAYRRARTQAAWAVAALSRVASLECIGRFDWRTLAAQVEDSPAAFLAAISHLGDAPSRESSSGPFVIDQDRIAEALRRVNAREAWPAVVTWTLLDLRRVTPVPPGHWLLLKDTTPFRAALKVDGDDTARNVESIAAEGGYVACFPPRETGGDATLWIERYAQAERHLEAKVRYLSGEPVFPREFQVSEPQSPASRDAQPQTSTSGSRPSHLALLTNGRGGMARLCLDLGRITSKYDCVLGANLHPTLPVDRHVMIKRMRVWANADGFIFPLDFRSLRLFAPGPPATWDFVANAGDGRTVQIQMRAEMLPDRNTVMVVFSRPTAAKAAGKQLPGKADVRLTVRLDLEDRNFHSETKRNSGADYHFAANTHTLAAEAGTAAPSRPQVGFTFTPAPDRRLRVTADSGVYHPQPEWSENIGHPVEQSRGQVGSGDAFSPGWFELPLPKGASVALVISADPTDPEPRQVENFRLGLSSPQTRDVSRETGRAAGPLPGEGLPTEDSFGLQLLRSARSFVVRRDDGKTVIAGYPWFLDWGRDTFICARGLLAAGLDEEVRQMLLTFARFEDRGTLPNTIHGSDASNRDTSDAPLWFGVVCEELAARLSASPSVTTTAAQEGSAVSQSPSSFYQAPAAPSGRSLRDVLESIARNYISGTPNGIRMDPSSALIWSPSHFTWMDTNYPASTPRQGYPVEIQALWIRLLRQLERISVPGDREAWGRLAEQATASLNQFFWREDTGYYADLLSARPGLPASAAVQDDALRSNCLLVISLGLAQGLRARRCVEAAQRYLVVPGALRSLAPLRVAVPLPVYTHDGRLLNNPSEPYWGRYEGDEDTRRKPAYHNGTAWTWTFPIFCEALARAWDFSPEAVNAAKAYLGSMERLLVEGCIGHLPEVLDGDAPHTQRGCDAQAWGATEALRVWRLLKENRAV